MTSCPSRGVRGGAAVAGTPVSFGPAGGSGSLGRSPCSDRQGQFRATNPTTASCYSASILVHRHESLHLPHPHFRALPQVWTPTVPTLTPVLTSTPFGALPLRFASRLGLGGGGRLTWPTLPDRQQLVGQTPGRDTPGGPPRIV